MSVSAVSVHRWTREEYERLAEDGFFQPEERVELVEGIVYDMPPQDSFHATELCLVDLAIRRVFAEGWVIRIQMPLALSADSEPEPDVAVVAGTPRDYLAAHPTTAALVVEVAGSSLLYDRQQKAPLYARAGIPEYWILHLREEKLEVYRDPSATGYRTRIVLGRGDTVTPLARPGVSLRVADLLP